MKKLLLVFTVLIILLFTASSSSYSFITLSKDPKTTGFVIVNSTKFLMKIVSYPQTTIKPDGGLAVKSENDAYRFGWKFLSDSEPYFDDVTYKWMPTTRANKVVVSGQNTGLNGYPWTLTKVQNGDKLALTFKSNVCTHGVIGLSDSTDEIARFSVKSMFFFPVKTFVGKTARVTFWKDQRFFTTTIAFPKGFKGGSYKLALDVKSARQTTINMVNDEKQNLSLKGCPSLSELHIGSDATIAHSSNRIPSEYNGRFFAKDLIYDKSWKNNGKDIVLSSKFSYDIHYSTQVKGEYPEGNVYCTTKPSTITKVVLDSASSKSAVFDVFDYRVHKLVYKNLKSWETKEDVSFLCVFVRFPTTSYYGIQVNFGKQRETKILACEDEVFGQNFAYNTKGFQFFADRDYFVSGLDLRRGNPYKQFDGVDCINVNMLVPELGATNIVADANSISFNVNALGSKNLAYRIKQREILINTADGVKMNVSAENIIDGSNIYVSVKNLEMSFGFKSKTYPQQKSVCLTIKQ